MKMGYYIIRSNYAPKIFKGEDSRVNANLHAVLVNYCNFRCKFCAINYANQEKYKEYTEFEFENEVCKLLDFSNGFKFSGGEPTLNPDLIRDLSIIKRHNGMVFIDTNGSKFEVIKTIVDLNLVDVFGFSLKGIDLKTAKSVSSIDDSDLVWNNVFKSISYSISNGIHVIVTMVCFSTTTFDDIITFSKFFSPGTVELKLNNYCDNGINEYMSLSPAMLVEYGNHLIRYDNKWKGHVIIINDVNAVHSYEKILFL